MREIVDAAREAGKRLSGGHPAAFAALLAAFVALSLAVITRSPVDVLDHSLAALHLDYHRWPQWYDLVNTFEMVGQRVPSTAAVLPWFIWRCRRAKSLHPLVTLATALLLLNLFVGAVKLSTGRVGPREASSAMLMFAGADIYPSGHVSNTVVLYGTIVLVAVTRRRLLTAGAIFLSLTVGVGTVYLRTHWLTDIVGGWMAGGLVLMMLPVVVPWAELGVDRLIAAAQQRYRQVATSAQDSARQPARAPARPPTPSHHPANT